MEKVEPFLRVRPNRPRAAISRGNRWFVDGDTVDDR